MHTDISLALPPLRCRRCARSPPCPAAPCLSPHNAAGPPANAILAGVGLVVATLQGQGHCSRSQERIAKGSNLRLIFFDRIFLPFLPTDTSDPVARVWVIQRPEELYQSDTGSRLLAP